MDREQLQELITLCDKVDCCNEHGEGVWNDDALATEWQDTVTTDVVRRLTKHALQSASSFDAEELPPLKLELGVKGGARVVGVFRHACHISTLLGITVAFDFNDTRVLIQPGSDPGECIQEFFAERERD